MGKNVLYLYILYKYIHFYFTVHISLSENVCFFSSVEQAIVVIPDQCLLNFNQIKPQERYKVIQ